jgi:hypothetical protein
MIVALLAVASALVHKELTQVYTSIDALGGSQSSSCAPCTGRLREDCEAAFSQSGEMVTAILRFCNAASNPALGEAYDQMTKHGMPSVLAEVYSGEMEDELAELITAHRGGDTTPEPAAAAAAEPAADWKAKYIAAEPAADQLEPVGNSSDFEPAADWKAKHIAAEPGAHELEPVGVSSDYALDPGLIRGGAAPARRRAPVFPVDQTHFGGPAARTPRGNGSEHWLVHDDSKSDRSEVLSDGVWKVLDPWHGVSCEYYMKYFDVTEFRVSWDADGTATLNAGNGVTPADIQVSTQKYDADNHILEQPQWTFTIGAKSVTVRKEEPFWLLDQATLAWGIDNAIRWTQGKSTTGPGGISETPPDELRAVIHQSPGPTVTHLFQHGHRSKWLGVTFAGLFLERPDGSYRILPQSGGGSSNFVSALARDMPPDPGVTQFGKVPSDEGAIFDENNNNALLNRHISSQFSFNNIAQIVSPKNVTYLGFDPGGVPGTTPWRSLPVCANFQAEDGDAQGMLPESAASYCPTKEIPTVQYKKSVMVLLSGAEVNSDKPMQPKGTSNTPEDGKFDVVDYEAFIYREILDVGAMGEGWRGQVIAPSESDRADAWSEGRLVRPEDSKWMNQTDLYFYNPEASSQMNWPFAPESNFAGLALAFTDRDNTTGLQFRFQHKFTSGTFKRSTNQTFWGTHGTQSRRELSKAFAAEHGYPWDNNMPDIFKHCRSNTTCNPTGRGFGEEEFEPKQVGEMQIRIVPIACGKRPTAVVGRGRIHDSASLGNLWGPDLANPAWPSSRGEQLQWPDSPKDCPPWYTKTRHQDVGGHINITEATADALGSLATGELPSGWADAHLGGLNYRMAEKLSDRYKVPVMATSFYEPRSYEDQQKLLKTIKALPGVLDAVYGPHEVEIWEGNEPFGNKELLCESGSCFAIDYRIPFVNADGTRSVFGNPDNYLPGLELTGTGYDSGTYFVYDPDVEPIDLGFGSSCKPPADVVCDGLAADASIPNRGKCMPSCPDLSKPSPDEPYLLCSGRVLTPSTYTCGASKPMLDCMNERMWRTPGGPNDEATMRGMVELELYKSGACSELSACQEKTDAELATMCDAGDLVEIDWCTTCLVKKGWRTSTECSNMARAEQVNTVINLLVKEGKEGTEAELQATKYQTLRGMCTAEAAWRDWCDVCMITKNVRTNVECSAMTNQEKHNTVVEELRASGATGLSLDELQASSFTKIQTLCKDPNVLSLFQDYLIREGDDPWVCWRDEDCAKSPRGPTCEIKPSNQDVSVCQPLDGPWKDLVPVNLHTKSVVHQISATVRSLMKQAKNLHAKQESMREHKMNRTLQAAEHLRQEAEAILKPDIGGDLNDMAAAWKSRLLTGK